MATLHAKLLNGMVGISSNLAETHAGYGLMQIVAMRVMKRDQNNAALDDYQEPVDAHDRPLPELTSDEWRMLDRVRGLITESGDPGMVGETAYGGRVITS